MSADQSLSGSRLEWMRANDAELMATLRYLEVLKIERRERRGARQLPPTASVSDPDDALASPLDICRSDDYFERRMVYNEHVARLLSESVDHSTAAHDAPLRVEGATDGVSPAPAPPITAARSSAEPSHNPALLCGALSLWERETCEPFVVQQVDNRLAYRDSLCAINLLDLESGLSLRP